MPKVILTVGISGSGKSTWVDQQIKEHTENSQVSVKIERDEIREFLKPGYWRQNPDAKFEKKVTEYQRDQLKVALQNEVPFIYISDTNLNLEFRSELWEYINELSNYQAEIEIVPFFESLDLNLCLSRNKKRERVVPEKVLIQQWKKFQNLYNTNEYILDAQNKPIIWVSDLHAQVGKLIRLLFRFPAEYYTYVFAGDLNDSTLPNLEDNFNAQASFLETYKVVRDIVENYGGILLHSNHQRNLINLITGRRKKLSYGLSYTAAELTWLGLDLETYEENENLLVNNEKTKASDELLEMATWFESRPVQCEIVHNNVVFRCAHAYPDNLDDFKPFPNNEETYIYGCVDANRNRINWWEKADVKNHPFGFVAGHYHTTNLDFENNVFVFDPDCGKTTEGELGYILFVDGEKVNAFTI